MGPSENADRGTGELAGQQSRISWGIEGLISDLATEDFVKIIFTELGNQDPLQPSDSKALLEQLCDSAMTRILDGAQELSGAGGSLATLVDLHVGFAVDKRALIGVWAREQRALSDDVRRSLRRRQRAYELVWREALTPLREDLTAEETQLVVTSTLALLNSTALVDTTVDPARLRPLLRRMALAALLSR